MNSPALFDAMPALDVSFPEAVLSSRAVRSRAELMVIFRFHLGYHILPHTHGLQWGTVAAANMALIINGQTHCHGKVMALFSDLTKQTAADDLNLWADTPQGRLALIVILDQLMRSVWAGPPRAHDHGPKARDLCPAWLESGQFGALPKVWQKIAFKTPLEHCECVDPVEHMTSIASGDVPHTTKLRQPQEGPQ